MVRGGSKIVVFDKVIEKLSVFLKDIKDMREPKHKKLRNYKKLELNAIEAYIKSCEWGEKMIREPNRVKQSAIVFQVSLAESYWEAAAKESLDFLKK